VALTRQKEGTKESTSKFGKVSDIKESNQPAGSIFYHNLQLKTKGKESKFVLVKLLRWIMDQHCIVFFINCMITFSVGYVM
jgi:hypothetical protein